MTAGTKPRLGVDGELPTATEIDLLVTPRLHAGEAQVDRIQGVAVRMAATLRRTGFDVATAQQAAAVAVVAMLEEFGGERVRLPQRRWFFHRLLRPELPTLLQQFRTQTSVDELAASLGVCRRTLERAANEKRQKGAALSRP